MRRLDNWLLSIADEAADRIDDWIPLRAVKSALFVLWVLGCFYDVTMDLIEKKYGMPHWLELSMFALAALVVSKYRRLTESQKAESRVGDLWIRASFLFVLVLDFVLLIHPDFRSFVDAASNSSLVALLYLAVANVNGERSKARKISLEKLKELFGGWVPAEAHRYSGGAK